MITVLDLKGARNICRSAFSWSVSSKRKGGWSCKGQEHKKKETNAKRTVTAAGSLLRSLVFSVALRFFWRWKVGLGLEVSRRLAGLGAGRNGSSCHIGVVRRRRSGGPAVTAAGLGSFAGLSRLAGRRRLGGYFSVLFRGRMWVLGGAPCIPQGHKIGFETFLISRLGAHNEATTLPSVLEDFV